MTYQKYDSPLDWLNDEDHELVRELHHRVAALLAIAETKKEFPTSQAMVDFGDCYALQYPEPYLFEVVCNVYSCRYVTVYNSYLNCIEMELIKTRVMPRLMEYMVLQDLANI